MDAIPLIILGFMTNDDSLRKGRQCVFDMHVHLVFVTKYRHKVFEDRHLDRLERIFRDVCESFDCRLEEFNGKRIMSTCSFRSRRPWRSADSSTR